MAFLDNSGDIILDAVLTDVGRRRMANGNFKIKKFALGDDEINYSQYQLNHPSGSAYSDLEILQTPVFEAITAESSAINYGLLSLTKLNILYLPSLKINQTISSTAAVQQFSNVFLLAVNGETFNRITTTDTGASAIAVSSTQVMHQGTTTSRAIYLESGIDTTDQPADAPHRQSLITSVGMLDLTFTIQMDRRLFPGFYELEAGQIFSAGADSDTPAIIADDLQKYSGGGSETPGLLNYISAPLRGLDNLLYAPTGTSGRTDPSVLAGPRGTAAAINFTIWPNMTSIAGTTPDKFTKHGKTSQVLFPLSTDKYDYIDTIVYVRGNASTSMVQIPMRIVRFSGA